MTDFDQEGQVLDISFTPDLSAYQPQNLKAKSHGKKVHVSWDKPLVNGVIHPSIKKFRIYHSTDNVNFSVIAETPQGSVRTWWWFPDLDVGTHYFKVSTVFKHGYESPLSDVVSVIHGEGYGT